MTVERAKGFNEKRDAEVSAFCAGVDSRQGRREEFCGASRRLLRLVYVINFVCM